MAITTLGIYQFRPDAEREGQQLLEEYVRFVRSRARVRQTFAGVALDTAHRWIVLTTYADARDAKDTEDGFHRQALASGKLGRLEKLCVAPPVHNRVLHD
jgi:hypothetical protein